MFHVAHKGKAGSLFDRDAARGAIVEAVAPREGEPVVEKGLPNAFAGTDLAERVAATGRKELIRSLNPTRCRSLHEVALVELSDRFAVIARGHDWG